MYRRILVAVENSPADRAPSMRLLCLPDRVEADAEPRMLLHQSARSQPRDEPLLKTGLASTLFAVALLFAGQNATLTGTLAGQIVMEGFLNIRLRPWLRRLVTRLIAIIPALITVYLYGERGAGQLLVLSQVILSLQLPFAVFPLVLFTGDRSKMGDLVAPKWMLAIAWPVALLIAGLNVWLLWQTFFG